MKNYVIGKREAYAAGSNKYGYSMDGICVKTPQGYRSVNGTLVKDAVSTDASCIVKEATYLADVRQGNIVVIDAIPYNVLSLAPVNDITTRFELLNLMTGQIEDTILGVEDRIVSVLWDTFLYPNKAVSGETRISLNEFTPAQLRELATGKTTLEELRTPKQAESLENVLVGIVKDVLAKANATDTAQG